MATNQNLGLEKRIIIFIICGYFVFSGCDDKKKEDPIPIPTPATEEPLPELQQPATEQTAASPAQTKAATSEENNSTSNEASASDSPDTQSPIIAIISHPGDQVLAITANFSFTVTDASIVSSTLCKLDNAVYAACSGSKSYEGLSIGPHTFYVKASDEHGNVSEASYSWNINFTLTAVPNSGNTEIDNAFAAHKTADGKYFLASFSGLGVSSDNGATWALKQPYGASSLSRCYDVGVTPAGKVFCAAKGAMSSTSNDGVNFTNITGSGLGSSQQTTVLIDPDDANIIYAGNAGGLAISTNGGSSYTNRTIADGLGANAVFDIVKNGAMLYSCTGGGLSISSDGGSHFTNKTSGDSLHGDSCTDLSVNSSGQIFASSYNGFSLSTNGGSTFYHFDMSLISSASIANVFLGDDGLMIIATSGKGFYLSSDSGASMTHFDRNNANILSDIIYKIDKMANGQIIFSTQKGVAETIIPESSQENLSDTQGPSISAATLSTSNLTSKQATISWSAAQDNSTAAAALLYQVYYAKGSQVDLFADVAKVYTNGSPAGNYTAAITEMTLDNLAPNQQYIINVIVKDQYGNKSAYTPITFTMLPQAWVQATADSSNVPNWNSTMVSYDNKMWILGGIQPPGATVINEVHHSSNGVNWTPVIQSGSEMERFDHSATVFNGKIWVIGGIGSDAQKRNDVLTTSDGANWTTETASAPFEVRNAHQALVFNDQLWVIAGEGDNGGTVKYLNDVWYYTGSSWIQKTAHAAFPERYSFGAVAFANKMWVVGGLGSSGGSGPGSTVFYSDVWYSEDGLNWSEARPSAEFGGRGSHATYVKNNKMWVVGGSTSGSYATNSYYTEDGINWNHAGNFNGREWAGYTVFDDKLWLYHGAYYGWPTSVVYAE